MIYFHRGLERTVAETPESAQRLEARGWVRCSADVHRALWRIADATRRAELDAERVLELLQPSAVGGALAPNAPATPPEYRWPCDANGRPVVTTSMHGWGV